MALAIVLTGLNQAVESHSSLKVAWTISRHAELGREFKKSLLSSGVSMMPTGKALLVLASFRRSTGKGCARCRNAIRPA